jgi:uncharacterized protein YbbC (DUF1343 family)
MKKNIIINLSLFLALFFFSNVLEARVYTGLEVFLAKYQNIVKGKRVGLITNQTGRDAKGRSAIDLLYNSPNVNLVALFAPEHGIRGKIKAGEHVDSGRDRKTGLPIYSLYGGKDHKPSKASLNKIDVLLYDIQDVGARPYTYVWHMAECMKAAAESGKTMIVLDRPNPDGASVVDGPVNEKKYISFIGLYQVPYVYGMTVGELAHYLNIEEKIKAKLYIVPMQNYRRGMSWKQTGLPWIAPSPNIPSPQSAYCFATTGAIGELKLVRIGIGTKAAFRVISASWLKPKFTAAALNNDRLPGVKFVPVRLKGVNAVLIHVTNPAVYRPFTTAIAILCHLRNSYPAKLISALKNKKSVKAFNKAVGTDKILKYLSRKGISYKNIVSSWNSELKQFNVKRKKYLIY